MTDILLYELVMICERRLFSHTKTKEHRQGIIKSFFYDFESYKAKEI